MTNHERTFCFTKKLISNNLESMKGSELVFDYVQLLYYECHKTNLNRGESYTYSPDQIRNKKAILYTK